MKRIIALLVSAIMLTSLLAACGGNANSTESKKADVKVVTTIFPIYDWVREIAQDDADINLDLLLDNGVDLHSYQPSAKDIVDISDCDIFIYVGGESDKWVDDTLKQANNKNMTVLNLMDILGDKTKEEEVKEGMQADEDEHEKGEEHKEGEEEHEYDEHVWLSLKNSALFVDKIADALGKVDTQHASDFTANAADYKNKLNELDKQYQDAVDKASVKTLLFGDRFPFRYLTDDYKLDYYAAFVGCSAETEASFERPSPSSRARRTSCSSRRSCRSRPRTAPSPRPCATIPRPRIRRS